jgi:hypothetical protein
MAAAASPLTISSPRQIEKDPLLPHDLVVPRLQPGGDLLRYDRPRRLRALQGETHDAMSFRKPEDLIV